MVIAGLDPGGYGSPGAGRSERKPGECLSLPSFRECSSMQVQAGQFAFYFRYPGRITPSARFTRR